MIEGLRVDDRMCDSVSIGNHILAVYESKQAKLDEAFRFLKAGLDNKEVAMIITDDMTKDEIRKRMIREWNVDVSALEAKGDIVIKNTQEWYYPRGKMQSERVIAMWSALAELSTVRGRKGVRVFGDVGRIFRDGFSKELVKYEESLDKNFEIPVTAVCAYEAKDFMRSLKPEQIVAINEHHGHIWR